MLVLKGYPFSVPYGIFAYSGSFKGLIMVS